MPNIEYSLLIFLFFATSFCYSLVGFGGGSTYIALLAIFNISHLIAPSIALICNITVVLGGTCHFLKNRQIHLPLIFPFLFLSIPASYVGGRIPIDRELYQLILGILLLIAATKMLFFKNKKFAERSPVNLPPFLPALIIGGVLGFVSGLVGIGGGIFLAPILYLAGWGSPRKNAAAATLFILINSLAGIIGQIHKAGSMGHLQDFALLMLSVFCGGQIGSWFCSNRISHRKIEVFTSFLLIFVSFKLLAV